MTNWFWVVVRQIRISITFVIASQLLTNLFSDPFLTHLVILFFTHRPPLLTHLDVRLLTHLYTDFLTKRVPWWTVHLTPLLARPFPTTASAFLSPKAVLIPSAANFPTLAIPIPIFVNKRGTEKKNRRFREWATKAVFWWSEFWMVSAVVSWLFERAVVEFPCA